MIGVPNHRICARARGRGAQDRWFRRLQPVLALCGVNDAVPDSPLPDAGAILRPVFLSDAPWDCHRTADQARGGLGGQCRHIFHTWSVWVLDMVKVTQNRFGRFWEGRSSLLLRKAWNSWNTFSPRAAPRRRTEW